MAIVEEAIEQFNKLPLEIQAEFGSDEVVNLLHEFEESYGISLVPLTLNVAAGYLDPKDLEEYIESDLGISGERNKILAADLREKLFSPLLDRLKFLNANPKKNMSLEQEESFAERIFRELLLSELHHDPIIITAVNNRLFYILARREDFQRRLEAAIYENQEMITKNKIDVNGSLVPGTVGNWLKDYIAQYGTENYDSVTQTAFLINSKNAKGLTEEERSLLSTVLKTYINIRFFPDSMPTDDGEGWEIIPGGNIDQPVGPANLPKSSVQQKTFISAPISEKKLDLEPITQSVPASARKSSRVRDQAPVLPRPSNSSLNSEPRPTASSVEKRTLEAPVRPADTAAVVEPVSESEELLALKNMLLQFPAGSLERAAVEEEIKKLEKAES